MSHGIIWFVQKDWLIKELNKWFMNVIESFAQPIRLKCEFIQKPNSTRLLENMQGFCVFISNAVVICIVQIALDGT